VKIYISGKITGLVYDQAFAMFEAAEVVLTKLGHEPVNPMKAVDQTEGRKYTDYLKDAIVGMFECDGIYLLSNWRESKGAGLEHLIAEQLGMLCVFEDNIKYSGVFSACSKCHKGYNRVDMDDLLLCSECRTATHCIKCGARLFSDDLVEGNGDKCYRCRNNISSVSGVGIMTHAKV
jgi:hypothetical protein